MAIDHQISDPRVGRWVRTPSRVYRAPAGMSELAARDGAPGYSRNPYNPYPSGDTLSYGLWEVMGLERLGALLAP